MKLCARLGAQRHPAEPSTGTSAPKAGKIAEGGKNRRRREKSPKAEKIAEGGKIAQGEKLSRFCTHPGDPTQGTHRRRREKSPKAGKIAEGGKHRRRREKPPKAEKIAEGGKLSGMGSQELRFCPWGYFFMENSNLTSRRAKKQKSS